MLVDLLLPGSILFLKLLFKLSIEQEMTFTDSAKAFLAFPIDVSFLALSFGVGVLAIKAPAGTLGPHKTTVIFMTIGILSMIIITILSKKSERAFLKDKIVASLLFCLFGYFISFSMVMACLNVEGYAP